MQEIRSKSCGHHHINIKISTQDFWTYFSTDATSASLHRSSIVSPCICVSNKLKKIKSDVLEDIWTCLRRSWPEDQLNSNLLQLTIFICWFPQLFGLSGYFTCYKNAQIDPLNQPALSWLFMFLCAASAANLERELFKDLMKGYNKNVRPMEKSGDITKVSIKMTLTNLISLVSRACPGAYD